MIKLTVLYGDPDNADDFESYYAGNHLPLLGKVPGVSRVETGKVLATPDGGEIPYYRVAELWFDGMEKMMSAMDSPEGKELAADLPRFATGGATVLITEVE